MTQRGSLTVEAVLVVPVVLLVVLAVFELVALGVTKLELTAAAREGARVAATVPDPGRAVAAVRETLSEPLRTRALVSVARPTVVGRPAEVTVSVSRPLRSPLLDAVVVPLSARAVMAVEP